MIQRVSFENFRALRSVSVDLAPFTVFVGPNGAGKSSLLAGVGLVLQALAGSLSEGVDAAWSDDVSVLSRDAVGATTISLEAVAQKLLLATLRVGPGEVGSVQRRVLGDGPVLASAKVVGQIEESIGEVEARGLAKSREPAWAELRAWLGEGVLHAFDAPTLARPSYSDEAVPRLGPNGEGLGSVLGDLWARRPETREGIVGMVRRVIPSVRGVRVERARVSRVRADEIVVNGHAMSQRRDESVWGQRVVVDTDSGSNIPLSAASEGTTLVLAVATAVLAHEHVRVLMLDELDRGLHPKAQIDLVAQLKEFQRVVRPGLQILATTHSPYLLDAVGFDEVRVTTLDPKGAVRCAGLDAHPEFELWRDMVKPGELWMAQLEGWVAQRGGGDP